MYAHLHRLRFLLQLLAQSTSQARVVLHTAQAKLRFHDFAHKNSVLKSEAVKGALAT